MKWSGASRRSEPVVSRYGSYPNALWETSVRGARGYSARMDPPIRRVADLYRGPGGRFWDRIEDERPGTYPEENLALGRRQEAALLAEWLGTGEPDGLSGLRVLDAGCGRGRFALHLASKGARVTGVDLVPRFAPKTLATARRGELSLVVGDFRDLALYAKEDREPPFDALLLREVIQDYDTQGQRLLRNALIGGPVQRLLITLRLGQGGWSRLFGAMWPEDLGNTVDPVAALRSIQLVTPYRLTRHQEVRRRNFHVWLGELTRMGTGSL